MTTISSTLQINLVEDATKNAPRVAAALEKMQKEATALQAALAKSGTTDKLQARLKTLGATEAHIDGVTKAWAEFAKAEGLAEHAAGWTQQQAIGVKRWEDATVAAVRLVKKEEAALARARHDQTVRAEQEAVSAAQQKAAEERRLAQETARDLKRLAEQQARDQRMLDRQATRDAEREERTRIRSIAKEQRNAQRQAEILAHEQARTDNTVAGVAALYAAHSAAHAAVAVGERYREFDKERRYGKVVMGLTDDQQKPLVDQAIRGSAGSRYNDVQWLAAQRALAARGYNRDQVLGFTPTASQLGSAFDLPAMEDAVKLFEGGMLGFKKDVSTREAAERNAQRTADLQVKTSKISGADADDITSLYKRGASAARMANLTEEQLLAFGGTLKKINIGGDEAATAFVALTKNLLHPTHEARTAMAAAGIDFSKYQKIGAVNEEGFASEVARNYGVKLTHGVRAGLHRIFSNPEFMKDPALFTPAVTHFLRRALNGNDAKSLKSIAGLAGRYRDDSATGVDTQGLLIALMAAMAKNPALANSIFGSKQGGRIASGTDKDVFTHLLDELQNHAQGFAQQVADARMTGFNGALDKLANQIAILETSIGRSFDNDGHGGFLTSATERLGQFVHYLGEANPKILRAGSEAVMLAGAFAALKSVDFLRGGFGLKASASALDVSAKLLDDAAIKLGATGDAKAAAAADALAKRRPIPGGALPDVPEGAPKGFFGGGFKGAIKSLPKTIVGAGPAAIAEYLAYQVATGAIDSGLDAGRDYFVSKERQYRTDKYNEQSFFQKFGLFGGASSPMDPRFDPPPATDSQPPKVPVPEDDAEEPSIAGKRASGGPVSRGKTYLVGEHGPELFTPGMNGAISTADVQRMLARRTPADRIDGDGETAKAVRSMSFELVSAVDGIARAVDRAGYRAERFDRGAGDVGADGESSGRRAFMNRPQGHTVPGHNGGGRRGFMNRPDHRIPDGRGAGGHPSHRGHADHTRPIDNDGSSLRGGRPASNRGLTAEGQARIDSWRDFFQRPKNQGGMGLSKDKAHAMIAMMQGESGINLRPDQEVYDVNGPSGGTAMWHNVDGKPGGRLAGLKAFAARLGKSWKDVGVQQAWWKHEAETTHRRAFSAIEAAKDADGALVAGIGGFEVPRDPRGEARKRRGYLRRLQQGPETPDGSIANSGHGTTDDPLGIRKKRHADHVALADQLRDLDQMAVSPDIDHAPIQKFIGHIRTARAELAKLHGAKIGRGSAASTQVAGLGSRTRGSFTSGGLTIG